MGHRVLAHRVLLRQGASKALPRVSSLCAHDWIAGWMEEEWSHEGTALRESMAVTLSIRVCHNGGCDLCPMG